jgi:predicted RNase H-like HicB family nuclease
LPTSGKHPAAEESGAVVEREDLAGREGALALASQRDQFAAMRNEFTAIIEKDGKWFVAYSPEVPGANGQGRTSPAAKQSLAAAIKLILADRRRDALRGLPRSAVRELLTVA